MKLTTCGHEPHYARGLCRKCYYQRPEVKEYKKEYYQRPEVKEHRKDYRKEYYQRPEVKEHQKEYLKEYQKEFIQRPEVKYRNKYVNPEKKLRKTLEKYHFSKETKEALVTDGILLDKRYAELSKKEGGKG